MSPGYALLFGPFREGMERTKKAIVPLDFMKRRVEITGKRAKLPYPIMRDHVSNGGAIRMRLFCLLVGGGRGDHVD